MGSRAIVPLTVVLALVVAGVDATVVATRSGRGPAAVTVEAAAAPVDTPTAAPATETTTAPTAIDDVLEPSPGLPHLPVATPTRPPVTPPVETPPTLDSPTPVAPPVTAPPVEISPTPVPPPPPPPADTSSGAGTWTTSQDGMTVTLRLDPAAPAAAQITTFTIEVTDRVGVRTVHIWYGDGRGDYPFDDPCERGRPPGPSTITTSVQHAYRHGSATSPAAVAGKYNVEVMVLRHRLDAQGRCGPDAGELFKVDLVAAVAVADGPDMGNGPMLPRIDFSNQLWTEDGAVAWQMAAYDHDGNLTRFELDWGDGSPVEVFELSCGDQWAGHHYPEGLDSTPILSHRYPHPGTYVTRARAISSDCDGGYVQEAVMEAEAQAP